MFHFSSLFASIGMFFGGMFGMHASSTPPSMHVPPGYWQSATSSEEHRMMPMMGNGVFGTVTAIDGTDLTVAGRQGTTTATTTYSVDASNAKVIKGPATSTASVSDISVGDRVVVQGTVTGDSIAATTIIDGRFMQGGMMMGRMGSTTRMWMGSSTPGMWHNGASSTPGMRHPTPGMSPQDFNPGGPMIPAGGHMQGQGDDDQGNGQGGDSQ